MSNFQNNIFKINDSIFNSNYVVNNEGGCLYFGNFHNIEINNCSFYNNSANDVAAGILLFSNNVIAIYNSNFTRNYLTLNFSFTGELAGAGFLFLIFMNFF